MNAFLFFTFLFCARFARLAFGDSYQDEECLLADFSKGVCKPYEYCPTAVVSMQKQIQAEGCPIEGDICCELNSRSNYGTTKTEDEDKALDDLTLKFYYNRPRKNSNFVRRNENYINLNSNYYNNKQDDSRSDFYYNGGNDNRPQRWPYRDEENSFVFPNSGLIPSNNYQNGNNYQGNTNHFGNQWQTTQNNPYPNYWQNRPGSVTLRPLLPTYKPNLNTNGPSSSDEWNQKRISERKCKEYFEQTVAAASGLPLVLNPKPIKNNLHYCIAPQQLIVGGQETIPGEFPHMASIFFPSKPGEKRICGGTLISDRYILTAAHCIVSGGKPVKILLGGHNINIDDEDSRYYSVAKVIVHPDYRPPVKYHDIALLRLSERVEFTHKIRPACLYTKHSLRERKVVALGWGVTAFGGELSDVLRKVSLNLYDRNICKEVYKKYALQLPQNIIESQICAGDIAGHKDTCRGDSGAPIEILGEKNSCNHYIIGITSFGIVCGSPNTTAVYTRVYSYLDWIESIVWPQ